MAIIKVFQCTRNSTERVVDLNPRETSEWVEALNQVLDEEGPDRAAFILERLSDQARRGGADLPIQLNTPYVNTLRPEEEIPYPGDRAMERRIKSLIRWNAMAMVVRQNKYDPGIGGHISTYASLATLLEVGFNHFFHARYGDEPGDLIYFQGHASPGVYARAFLEGRLSEEHLRNFRHELRDHPGLPSYPHPWLMPDFWSFPTVSMGLASINSIYQARFMRYMENRGLIPATPRKIWAFLGDGEMDEPESMGSITLGSREKLDNLIFVINCNLQRLDGPVRGNGKVIQELEAAFRGAGWNVIKVVWGEDWDPLLARDTDGLLQKRMGEVVDGEWQNYVTKDGAYFRENFFGKYPELLEMVAHLGDEQLMRLRRGGHDPKKVYNAYQSAVENTGRPTLILAQTIKGYGLGEAGEGRNITHQQKKLNEREIALFRSRFEIPIPDEAARNASFYRPPDDSPEIAYLHERRRLLGGYVPNRNAPASKVEAPPLEYLAESLAGSRGREVSTTMAFVRILTLLLKNETLGKHVVPIIPDEARTFGMESLFRQYGIYASKGQLYKPHDAEMFLYYKESKDGQILEEGITEAGSMASFTAAGTAYTNYPRGDDSVLHVLLHVRIPARGRSHLGLRRRARQRFPDGRHRRPHHPFGRRSAAPGWPQHRAGQHRAHLRHLRSGLCLRNRGHRAGWHPPHVPGAGRPVLLPDTLQRELPHAADAGRRSEGILKGIYRYKTAPQGQAKAQLFGSGPILNEALRAQQILAEKYDVPKDVWSVTSYNELRRDALRAERWNRLHPGSTRAAALYPAGAGRRRGTDRRRHRLHEGGRRPDRAVAARPHGDVGHRWLRPQRQPRVSAPPFRSQRGIHRRRHALAPRARRPVPHGAGYRGLRRTGCEYGKDRPRAGMR